MESTQPISQSLIAMDNLLFYRQCFNIRFAKYHTAVLAPQPSIAMLASLPIIYNSHLAWSPVTRVSMSMGKFATCSAQLEPIPSRQLIPVLDVSVLAIHVPINPIVLLASVDTFSKAVVALVSAQVLSSSQIQQVEVANLALTLV